jgi:hypothetical protein
MDPIVAQDDNLDQLVRIIPSQSPQLSFTDIREIRVIRLGNTNLSPGSWSFIAGVVVNLGSAPDHRPARVSMTSRGRFPSSSLPTPK